MWYSNSDPKLNVLCALQSVSDVILILIQSLIYVDYKCLLEELDQIMVINGDEWFLCAAHSCWYSSVGVMVDGRLA